MPTELLADMVAIVHIIWVLFSAVTFLWILAAFLVHQKFLDWFWFRTIHLLFVILISLLPRFGMNCPLSIIEQYLRMQTGSAFEESFALHYLRELVYEGIGPVFIEVATLVMFLGTLAAYLYRPPRQASRLAKVYPLFKG